MKLYDKVLIIVFSFSSLLLILVRFLIGNNIVTVLIIGGTIYIISFLITYIVSRHFSRRLVDLTFDIEEMAAGNLSKKLKVNSRDEIGQLAHSLNDLRARLQTGVAIDVSKNKGLNQAKTDFVTIASHQLRTPLSIIKWYVDYLINEDAGRINEEQEKYLKEIYLSNERLIELVNGLLDVSRIDLGTFSIDPEPMDIISRAEEALNKFKEEINTKKLKIIKSFDKIPIINLDPRLTKILFENIFSNAVKYTPEKGTISLVIKRTEKDVLIKISDTGCGIPREQQPKIFTKLFRADNVKKIESVGTGLGLYIAKAIIEKSGGKIWFQSPSFDLLLDTTKETPELPLDKRNLGTTFFITIPLKGMRAKKGTKKLTSIEYHAKHKNN